MPKTDGTEYCVGCCRRMDQCKCNECDYCGFDPCRCEDEELDRDEDEAWWINN